ncbi:hypothetical protein GMRT_16314 [Giardia muris]|uniref:Uncharacterized protein n=1 Tax=Giardia muris TaxID=5742 RepID=A0A4Z1SVI9_GIAMU|nr:hypothetical protein GMRT_16314 [Giardia muris]|eukprot:TNJ29660.1 hypothetical protein GMRT_16314 [Giardia muris]
MSNEFIQTAKNALMEAMTLQLGRQHVGPTLILTGLAYGLAFRLLVPVYDRLVLSANSSSILYQLVSITYQSFTFLFRYPEDDIIGTILCLILPFCLLLSPYLILLIDITLHRGVLRRRLIIGILWHILINQVLFSQIILYSVWVYSITSGILYYFEWLLKLLAIILIVIQDLIISLYVIPILRTSTEFVPPDPRALVFYNFSFVVLHMASGCFQASSQLCCTILFLFSLFHVILQQSSVSMSGNLQLDLEILVLSIITSILSFMAIISPLIDMQHATILLIVTFVFLCLAIVLAVTSFYITLNIRLIRTMKRLDAIDKVATYLFNSLESLQRYVQRGKRHRNRTMLDHLFQTLFSDVDDRCRPVFGSNLVFTQTEHALLQVLHLFLRNKHQTLDSWADMHAPKPRTYGRSDRYGDRMTQPHFFFNYRSISMNVHPPIGTPPSQFFKQCGPFVVDASYFPTDLLMVFHTFRTGHKVESQTAPVTMERVMACMELVRSSPISERDLVYTAAFLIRRLNRPATFSAFFRKLRSLSLDVPDVSYNGTAYDTVYISHLMTRLQDYIVSLLYYSWYCKSDNEASRVRLCSYLLDVVGYTDDFVRLTEGLIPKDQQTESSPTSEYVLHEIFSVQRLLAGENSVLLKPLSDFVQRHLFNTSFSGQTIIGSVIPVGLISSSYSNPNNSFSASPNLDSLDLARLLSISPEDILFTDEQFLLLQRFAYAMFAFCYLNSPLYRGLFKRYTGSDAFSFTVMDDVSVLEKIVRNIYAQTIRGVRRTMSSTAIIWIRLLKFLKISLSGLVIGRTSLFSFGRHICCPSQSYSPYIDSAFALLNYKLELVIFRLIFVHCFIYEATKNVAFIMQTHQKVSRTNTQFWRYKVVHMNLMWVRRHLDSLHKTGKLPFGRSFILGVNRRRLRLKTDLVSLRLINDIVCSDVERLLGEIDHKSDCRRSSQNTNSYLSASSCNQQNPTDGKYPFIDADFFMLQSVLINCVQYIEHWFWEHDYVSSSVEALSEDNFVRQMSDNCNIAAIVAHQLRLLKVLNQLAQTYLQFLFFLCENFSLVGVSGLKDFCARPFSADSHSLHPMAEDELGNSELVSAEVKRATLANIECTDFLGMHISSAAQLLTSLATETMALHGTNLDCFLRNTLCPRFASLQKYLFRTELHALQNLIIPSSAHPFTGSLLYGRVRRYYVGTLEHYIRLRLYAFILAVQQMPDWKAHVTGVLDEIMQSLSLRTDVELKRLIAMIQLEYVALLRSLLRCLHVLFILFNEEPNNPTILLTIEMLRTEFSLGSLTSSLPLINFKATLMEVKQRDCNNRSHIENAYVYLSNFLSTDNLYTLFGAISAYNKSRINGAYLASVCHKIDFNTVLMTELPLSWRHRCVSQMEQACAFTTFGPGVFLNRRILGGMSNVLDPLKKFQNSDTQNLLHEISQNPFDLDVYLSLLRDPLSNFRRSCSDCRESLSGRCAIHRRLARMVVKCDSTYGIMYEVTRRYGPHPWVIGFHDWIAGNYAFLSTIVTTHVPVSTVSIVDKAGYVRSNMTIKSPTISRKQYLHTLGYESEGERKSGTPNGLFRYHTYYSLEFPACPSRSARGRGRQRMTSFPYRQSLFAAPKTPDSLRYEKIELATRLFDDSFYQVIIPSRFYRNMQMQQLRFAKSVSGLIRGYEFVMANVRLPIEFYKRLNAIAVSIAGVRGNKYVAMVSFRMVVLSPIIHGIRHALQSVFIATQDISHWMHAKNPIKQFFRGPPLLNPQVLPASVSDHGASSVDTVYSTRGRNSDVKPGRMFQGIDRANEFEISRVFRDIFSSIGHLSFIFLWLSLLIMVLIGIELLTMTRHTNRYIPLIKLSNQWLELPFLYYSERFTDLLPKDALPSEVAYPFAPCTSTCDFKSIWNEEFVIFTSTCRSDYIRNETFARYDALVTDVLDIFAGALEEEERPSHELVDAVLQRINGYFMSFLSALVMIFDFSKRFIYVTLERSIKANDEYFTYCPGMEPLDAYAIPVAPENTLTGLNDSFHMQDFSILSCPAIKYNETGRYFYKEIPSLPEQSQTLQSTTWNHLSSYNVINYGSLPSILLSPDVALDRSLASLSFFTRPFRISSPLFTSWDVVTQLIELAYSSITMSLASMLNYHETLASLGEQGSKFTLLDIVTDPEGVSIASRLYELFYTNRKGTYQAVPLRKDYVLDTRRGITPPSVSKSMEYLYPDIQTHRSADINFISPEHPLLQYAETLILAALPGSYSLMVHQLNMGLYGGNSFSERRINRAVETSIGLNYGIVTICIFFHLVALVYFVTYIIILVIRLWKYNKQVYERLSAIVLDVIKHNGLGGIYAIQALLKNKPELTKRYSGTLQAMDRLISNVEAPETHIVAAKQHAKRTTSPKVYTSKATSKRVILPSLEDSSSIHFHLGISPNDPLYGLRSEWRSFTEPTPEVTKCVQCLSMQQRSDALIKCLLIILPLGFYIVLAMMDDFRCSFRKGYENLFARRNSFLASFNDLHSILLRRTTEAFRYAVFGLPKAISMWKLASHDVQTGFTLLTSQHPELHQELIHIQHVVDEIQKIELQMLGTTLTMACPDASFYQDYLQDAETLKYPVFMSPLFEFSPLEDRNKLLAISLSKTPIEQQIHRLASTDTIEKITSLPPYKDIFGFEPERITCQDFFKKLPLPDKDLYWIVTSAITARQTLADKHCKKTVTNGVVSYIDCDDVKTIAVAPADSLRYLPGLSLFPTLFAKYTEFLEPVYSFASVMQLNRGAHRLSFVMALVSILIIVMIDIMFFVFLDRRMRSRNPMLRVANLVAASLRYALYLALLAISFYDLFTVYKKDSFLLPTAMEEKFKMGTNYFRTLNNVLNWLTNESEYEREHLTLKRFAQEYEQLVGQQLSLSSYSIQSPNSTDFVYILPEQAFNTIGNSSMWEAIRSTYLYMDVVSDSLAKARTHESTYRKELSPDILLNILITGFAPSDKFDYTSAMLYFFQSLSSAYSTYGTILSVEMQQDINPYHSTLASIVMPTSQQANSRQDYASFPVIRAVGMWITIMYMVLILCLMANLWNIPYYRPTEDEIIILGQHTVKAMFVVILAYNGKTYRFVTMVEYPDEHMYSLIRVTPAFRAIIRSEIHNRVRQNPELFLESRPDFTTVLIYTETDMPVNTNGNGSSDADLTPEDVLRFYLHERANEIRVYPATLNLAMPFYHCPTCIDKIIVKITHLNHQNRLQSYRIATKVPYNIKFEHDFPLLVRYVPVSLLYTNFQSMGMCEHNIPSQWCKFCDGKDASTPLPISNGPGDHKPIYLDIRTIFTPISDRLTEKIDQLVKGSNVDTHKKTSNDHGSAKTIFKNLANRLLTDQMPVLNQARIVRLYLGAIIGVLLSCIIAQFVFIALYATRTRKHMSAYSILGHILFYTKRLLTATMDHTENIVEGSISLLQKQYLENLIDQYRALLTTGYVRIGRIPNECGLRAHFYGLIDALLELEYRCSLLQEETTAGPRMYGLYAHMMTQYRVVINAAREATEGLVGCKPIATNRTAFFTPIAILLFFLLAIVLNYAFAWRYNQSLVRLGHLLELIKK